MLLDNRGDNARRLRAFQSRLADCLDMNRRSPGRTISRSARPASSGRFGPGGGRALRRQPGGAHDGRAPRGPAKLRWELLGPTGAEPVCAPKMVRNIVRGAEVKSAHLVVDPWAHLRRDGGRDELRNPGRVEPDHAREECDRALLVETLEAGSPVPSVRSTARPRRRGQVRERHRGHHRRTRKTSSRTVETRRCR